MRVRFWGTRGSMPVALTAADVRDKLAQALVAADGRRFGSFGAAYDFAQRELPFALTHTFGGHSSCVELETGSNRSEEHTSELQSPCNLVCRLLLEKKNNYI